MALAFSQPRLNAPVAGPLLSYIGNTPLVRIEHLAADLPGIEVYAKAEFTNPGGSVKDRPALNMILDGELTGRLRPGRIILDATSGNTGIAYAMIGAARGYKVRLCLPANASPERKRILNAHGADIVLTDPGEGADGAIRKCRKLYAADPDIYFYPDQYNNPANWRAHFNSTAPEIMMQTRRRITHFVAGLGTSGTFTGVSRRLKRDMPGVRCLAVQPDSGFHGLEGLKHMPSSIVPGIYDPTLVDVTLSVSTEDAHRTVRRLAREEGLLAGVSSGANVFAAHQLGRSLAEQGREAVIVTVLCDGAEKYLSEPFWNDPD